MPYYREDLQACRCSIPGCDCSQREEEIFFHSRCHPAAPTWARYRGDVLTIECSVCHAVVLSVVVASRGADARILQEPDPGDEERCP